MSIKQRARLENWSIVGTLPSPYAAPEQTVFRLQGRVYGHPDPNLRDGQDVVTASFVDMDIKERWVQTKNTLYTLGEPDPEYVKYMVENFMEQAIKYGLAPCTECMQTGYHKMSCDYQYRAQENAAVNAQ